MNVNESQPSLGTVGQKHAEARAPLPDVAPERLSAATEPTEDQYANVRLPDGWGILDLEDDESPGFHAYREGPVIETIAFPTRLAAMVAANLLQRAMDANEPDLASVSWMIENRSYTSERESDPLLAAAFDEGMRAHGLDGFTRDDNPYELTDQRHQQWLCGWYAEVVNDGPSAVMGITTSGTPANDELIDDEDLPF